MNRLILEETSGAREVAGEASEVVVLAAPSSPLGDAGVTVTPTVPASAGLVPLEERPAGPPQVEEREGVRKEDLADYKEGNNP